MISIVCNVWERAETAFSPLAKVDVEGSNPFSRSKIRKDNEGLERAASE
jgi:hypothetical protein